jgi:hypothetical protein
MLIYIPNIYTKSYLNCKNILSLCLNKKLGNNIIKLINKFLFEYNTNFTLFDNKKYIINNIFIHKNYGGHPFELIILLLYKFNIYTSNEQFNKILKNMNTIPNFKKIDLTECLTYLIHKYRNIINELNKQTDFNIIYSMIDNNIGNIEISNIFKHIKYMHSKLYNKYNKYIDDELLYFTPNKIYNKLENIITNKCEYQKKIINNLNNNNLYYEKYSIVADNFIMIQIKRFTIEYSNNFNLKFDKTILEIPNILNLPDFVFYFEDKKIYELIAVIIYDYDIKQYSIIIKEYNNYYHYLYDHIIKTDDKYFYEKTVSNAIALFYRIYN